MNKFSSNYSIDNLITLIPALALLPLIIGIFFKLGYLIPFDLKFLITSFSYSELALSSYSSLLFALVSLYGYSLMKLHILDNISWKLIFVANTSFVIVHYLPIFDTIFLDLVEKLLLLNALIFFNFKRDLVARVICIFILVVVAPAVNGFAKYYEFESVASNIIVLEGDSTEWLLVEKLSDTLVLVDKKTLRDKNYRFKFIELKEIDFMKSELWKHLSKL